MSGEPEGPVYRPRTGSGLDPATKRLALIAGGIGLFLVLVVGGWSLGGRHGAGSTVGGIPVFGPDPGPVKVKPVNPGGLQLTGAEPPPANDDNGAGPALAPGPEKPDPAALQAELDAARRASAPAPAAPPHATASAAPVAAAAVGTGGAHAAISSPAAPAPPPSTPAPVPGAAPAKPAGVAVQLAAVDTRDDAEALWTRLTRAHPDLLDGRAPIVIPVAHEGKTMFRLRTGGFPTIAAAGSFCAHLRAAGAACTIATF